MCAKHPAHNVGQVQIVGPQAVIMHQRVLDSINPGEIICIHLVLLARQANSLTTEILAQNLESRIQYRLAGNIQFRTACLKPPAQFR